MKNMINSFKRIYDNIFLYSITIGSTIGTIVFISIFGISVLNPKNIDWYINLSGDPGQQIIGWLACLRSDYFFPVGLTDYLLYPDKYSTIYTDSIPLVSFILKPLYYLIGDFQYFGIYGLFNFIMQAVLSIIIIRKFTNNNIISIFGSLLVVFSLIFFHRIFVHHSLSSHWIILTVIAYIMYNYKIYNLKRDIIFFIIISFIASGVHFYFFPMVFGLCIMYIIYKLIVIKKIMILIVPFVSFFIALLTMYIFGAFYNISSSNSYGLGFYNFNFNNFFNSFGYSKILSNLPTFGGQYEGMAYLGFGAFLLIIYVILELLFGCEEKNIKDKVAFVLILLTTFIFIIVSTGGNFSFGEHVFLEIKFPDIFETFRSSGRFIWVSCYIIIFSSIYIFSKYVDKKNIF